MTKQLDDIFPGLETGSSDHTSRDQAEAVDVASIQNELSEQVRIGVGTFNPFDKNRVETPGTGDGQGGRVKINPNHWAE